MNYKAWSVYVGLAAFATPAVAQVDLTAYANKDGYIDVQALTCAQLANTYQEDADYLTVWHSGWYNGLAKKHLMKVDRARDLEHQITRSGRPARLRYAAAQHRRFGREDRGVSGGNGWG